MDINLKKYLKNECQLYMFKLDHENPPDFYVSCWQRNRSPVPLLLLRALLLIGCVAILVSSMVISTKVISFGMWFIFMTHWGLILITLSSGFAFAISVIALIKGPRESSLSIWVKLYWVIFNTSITIAFFITIFYWVLLTELAEDYGMDPVLDVFVHAINSVMMLVLLLVSRHPMRLMHFYIPLVFGIVYTIFSIIFYASGAISPFGERWIYPMLDWSQPGQTILWVFISALGLIVIHLIVVGLAVARDAVTKGLRTPRSLNISNSRYN